MHNWNQSAAVLDTCSDKDHALAICTVCKTIKPLTTAQKVSYEVIGRSGFLHPKANTMFTVPTSDKDTVALLTARIDKVRRHDKSL